MIGIALGLAQVVGETFLKTLPVTLALAIVFTVLLTFGRAIRVRPGGRSASCSLISSTGSSFR